jgi:hypothetical protein
MKVVLFPLGLEPNECQLVSYSFIHSFFLQHTKVSSSKYEADSEPAPTSAPSTGCLLLLSCG